MKEGVLQTGKESQETVTELKDMLPTCTNQHWPRDAQQGSWPLVSLWRECDLKDENCLWVVTVGLPASHWRPLLAVAVDMRGKIDLKERAALFPDLIMGKEPKNNKANGETTGQWLETWYPVLTVADYPRPSTETLKIKPKETTIPTIPTIPTIYPRCCSRIVFDADSATLIRTCGCWFRTLLCDADLTWWFLIRNLFW